MRKIFYSKFILILVSSIIFITGCHKEESIQVQTVMPTHKETRVFFHIDSIKGLKNYLDRQLSKLEGSRSSFFTREDIDTSKVMIVEYSPSEITYSLPIRSDSTDNWVYNLVILKENGSFSNTKVAALRHFTNGDFGMYQYAFEEAFGTGSRSNTLKECWKSYIKVTSSGSGAQGSSGNGGGGSGNNNNFGNVIYTGAVGGWWGSFTGGGQVGGSGNGGGNGTSNPPNGGSAGNGTSGPQGCDGILIWLPWGPIPYICVKEISAPNYTLKGDDPSGSRTLSEECKKLLMRHGFIDEECNMQEDYGEKLMNDCRRKNAGLSQKIQDASSGSIINPCTGFAFNFDADLLERTLCFDDKYTDEGFDEWLDEQLDGVDYIDLDEIPVHLMDCSKSEAQNISDFNTYMQANNGCSGQGFDNALNSYLGFNSPWQQGVQALSATNHLCAQSINFSTSTWHANEEVAMISGLQISLSQNINLKFDILKLTMDKVVGCSLDNKQIVAMALKNTINSANTAINNSEPLRPNSTAPLNGQFLWLLDAEIRKIANNFGCGGAKKLTSDGKEWPNTSGYDAKIFGADNSNHCGAPFNQFSQMQTGNGC